MDPKDQARTAVSLLTPLVDTTDVAHLDWTTPCSQWNVRDLLNHVTGGGHMFAAGLRGDAIEIPAGPVDLLGDDHRRAFHSAIDAFSTALAQTDGLDKPVTLPFGTVPAEIALRLAAGDLLVHGWDLATATGQRFEPPAEFIRAVEGFYRAAVTDEMRAAGLFAPLNDAPADATPLERLVAFAGRSPRR
ncbi:MAG: TIGR03086 family metal-binding protein [Acidimicrobiia bacterium]